VRDGDHNILPSDLYDPVTYAERPGELAVATDTSAFSKWYDTKGNCTWEPCTILDYDQEQGRYLIKWPTGVQKYVSRLNLRHQQDNDKTFSKRIEEAEVLRK
jgi:hypothetical protein